MAVFAFDAERHRYLLDDQELPFVTGILTRTGFLADHARTDPFYAERGQAVHQAIHLALVDQLDETTVDPEHVRPYLERARYLARTLDLEPILLEAPLYTSSEAPFAGTLDFFGRAGALGGAYVLLDWKTGQHERGHELQVVGGYRRLLVNSALHQRVPLLHGHAYNARCGVVSLATDPPKVRWYEPQDPAPAETFRAALAVYNALPHYGAKP